MVNVKIDGYTGFEIYEPKLRNYKEGKDIL